MEVTVWTLTTDADSIQTTVHATEADAMRCLRDGFALGEDVSDEDLTDYVVSQGVVLYIEEQEVEMPDETTELVEALQACANAASGDSNDTEIEALNEALDLALARWPGVERPEPPYDD